MSEYRQIIYRLQKGESIRAIAREGFASRQTVGNINKVAELRGWLDENAGLPPDAELTKIFSVIGSAKTISKAEPYADLISQWADDGVQASTIHQHLCAEYDFQGSYMSVLRFVQKLEKAKPRKNITVPLHFEPGQAAQVDFGQGPILLDERTGEEEKTWFFVMTLCWSRHQYAVLITHQDIETWLNCHQKAFEHFGGVPAKIIIDNPKCAIIVASYHTPVIQRSYEEFAQAYSFIISACPPREPKKKGRVESGIKYVKKNFLPLRELKSLQQANKELAQWVRDVASQRTHGSTFEKPLDRFNATEKAQLKALPIVTPEIAIFVQVTVYRNCHVPYQRCYYSAPFRFCGEALWLKATAQTVTLYHENEIVTLHTRLFKPGFYSTYAEHLPANARIFLQQDADWCLRSAKRLGEHTTRLVEQLLNHPTNDLLRAAQLVIRLASEYSGDALESACKRALRYGSASYDTVRSILRKGLQDSQEISGLQAAQELGCVYQGAGTYQRRNNEPKEANLTNELSE